MPRRSAGQPPRLVAVVPIYNEAPTVLGVLTETLRRVDMLIAVDDGSTDETPALLRKWAHGNRKVRLIRLARNEGMAGALKRGLRQVEKLLKSGSLRGDDVVINIDADGQHRPEYIRPIARFMGRRGADVVLTKRDFSKYPLYKRMGNRALSLLARVLSGYPYRDVESGLRFMRARVVPAVLDYFTGWRYSCAQEIALITVMLGFKVDNSYEVSIAYYRPGTKLRDGLIVVLMGLIAFVRLKRGWKVR